jgi:hypothetical protein
MISKGCLVRYRNAVEDPRFVRQGVYLTISDTYRSLIGGGRMVDIILDGKTWRAATKLLEKVQ